jgi:23S rRNA (cytidine1920-2'-O)/16S rRNA (cytidine1409-2'-O)-methyltransferase
LRAEAVADVAAAASDLGLGVAGVAASPLPGPSGNVEFFVWFRRAAPPADRDEIDRVVAAGPGIGVASGAPAEPPKKPEKPEKLDEAEKPDEVPLEDT